MTSNSIDDAVPRPADADYSAWPGLIRPPETLGGRFRRRIAAGLFRRAARRLPVRVEYPDGSVVGAAQPETILPRLIVRRPDAFADRIGRRGLIGFGEAYMAGDWTAPDLEAVLTVFAARMASLVPVPLQKLRSVAVPARPATEDASEANARDQVSHHYDLSNDFFALFLDPTLSYSSALFDASAHPDGSIGRRQWAELEGAQQRKIDRLLDAAGVGPGTRVLEIGTGWGELSIRAAARGATVRSVTLSSEQRHLAQQRVAEAGLRDLVRIELLDYRSVAGTYDVIVSVEMIEAVGHRDWPTYFRTLDNLLAPGGSVALQSITMPHDRMLATRNTYTWIQKYIFPGGFLPSARALEAVAAKHTSLRVRDRLAFGPHYAETLRLWRERFEAADHAVTELGFDNVFRRMWRFYLAYAEAGFRSGYLDVEQILLTRAEALP